MKNLLKLIPSIVRATRHISYEVLYVEEFKDKTQVGECRPNEKQIVLKNKESQTETFKTFIHEICHMISFEQPGLNLTEKQVRALEEGLYRVLKLNGVLDKLLKGL